MICFTDFKFKYESYKDLADNLSDPESSMTSSKLEFIFMSDTNLYMFIGYLLSEGVNSEDISGITPMLDDLRCKDIEDHSEGCYVMINFTPRNFEKYRNVIRKFSKRFNMATSDY